MLRDLRVRPLPFREEAKKRVLVCANCHGEIEAGMIESPPAGALSRAALAARPKLNRAS